MLPASALQPTLKKGALRIYGVVGDSYLQNRVIAAILNQFLDSDVREFNLDTVRGNNSSVSDVLSLCANMPFLAERRAVVVTEIEKLDNIGKSSASDAGESGADEAETAGQSETEEAPRAARGAAKVSNAAKTLSEGLKNLPASTLLILARTPETPDVNARKKERRLINAAIDKIIEGKDGVIFDCTIDPNNSGAAIKLLQEEARARSIELSPPIAAQLVERCGTDLQLLINELEKCALSAGNNPITLEVVAEMTQPALHNTTFDLIDAIIDRRGAPALDIVRQLFAANISPEQLLGQLIGHLRLLLQARALIDFGATDARAFASLTDAQRAQFPKDGMVVMLNNPGQKFRANKMLTQGRRLPVAQLQSALEMAFETDLSLKGIAGDGGFVPTKEGSKASLEILIARLCGK